MRKTITMSILAAALVASTAQAESSLTAEQHVSLCRLLSDLHGHAMDLRVKGTPRQEARFGITERVNEQWKRQAWETVVVTVYDLPQSALYGSGRADLLSTVFDTCMTVK